MRDVRDMPREMTEKPRPKRPPLIKSAGCCLMLDPAYSSSDMYLADEGTYVCKAFSPRSYVIQKVYSRRCPCVISGAGACRVDQYVEREGHAVWVGGNRQRGATGRSPFPLSVPLSVSRSVA